MNDNQLSDKEFKKKYGLTREYCAKYHIFLSKEGTPRLDTTNDQQLVAEERRLPAKHIVKRLGETVLDKINKKVLKNEFPKGYGRTMTTILKVS